MPDYTAQFKYLIYFKYTHTHTVCDRSNQSSMSQHIPVCAAFHERLLLEYTPYDIFPPEFSKMALRRGLSVQECEARIGATVTETLKTIKLFSA